MDKDFSDFIATLGDPGFEDELADEIEKGMQPDKEGITTANVMLSLMLLILRRYHNWMTS